MAEQSYFMGQDGFIWFVGVVEDRNDPERIGRVRVRCLGFHTEDLNLLPTIDLPWAHVMHPVTDPSMHGMGNTPSFLVEGSWVIGFFGMHKKTTTCYYRFLAGGSFWSSGLFKGV